MMAAAVASDYEQVRQRRLEENKKRMLELNLPQLTQTLKPESPKNSPAKQAKPRARKEMEPVYVEVRRSSRVATIPAPNYKEDLHMLDYERRPRGQSKRRCLLNRIYASDKARSDAIDRANSLQLDLDPEIPSFVKPMLQSHVTGGFWLGLPRYFCDSHLPKHDDTITLVDENGDETKTVYLSQKNGLSGGWRGFSLDHGLVDGDALVFQLIKPTKFKVFIIKANK